jgi:hypothetical protein
VLGLVSGGLLADGLGYLGVFGALLVLAIGWRWSLAGNCRKPARPPPRVALWPLACRMVRDTDLWRSAALVALFNTMLFGYYSLAPFLFAGLGLSAGEFGYSGIVLALATLVGSLLNKRLLGRGWTPASLIGSPPCWRRVRAGWWASQASLWFLLPMTGVVIAFGLAIPNVLSQACWPIGRWRAVPGPCSGSLLPAAQPGVGGCGQLAGSRAAARGMRSAGTVLRLASFT